MFEAVRSGFDGRLAIDDVNFLAGPCSIPRMCSFEDQRCGYSSSGKVQWLHRSGHTVTIAGPKIDHTLETELGKKESHWLILHITIFQNTAVTSDLPLPAICSGFYMMANTGANILPSGSTTVLTSPVRQATAKTECVNFWYQMGGVNPGETPPHTKRT